MRKLKITEEQAKALVAEGVTLNANVAATNGNVDQAVRNTKQQARNSGLDLKDATIQIAADETNESRVMSAKDVREARLNSLRKHAQTFTVKDFMSAL